MPLGLVAYASSDEGSDNEEEVQDPVPEKATVKPSNESSNVGVEESNEISAKNWTDMRLLLRDYVVLPPYNQAVMVCKGKQAETGII